MKIFCFRERQFSLSLSLMREPLHRADFDGEEPSNVLNSRIHWMITVHQLKWTVAYVIVSHSAQQHDCQCTGPRQAPVQRDHLPCTHRHHWDDQEHTSHSVETADTWNSVCEQHMAQDTADETVLQAVHIHQPDNQVAGTVTSGTRNRTQTQSVRDSEQSQQEFTRHRAHKVWETQNSHSRVHTSQSSQSVRDSEQS